MNIALDVSGSGVIPLASTTSPTRIVSLSVFLVSVEQRINVSIAAAGLLDQESGSTVKHLQYNVPSQWHLALYPHVDKTCSLTTMHRLSARG